MLFRIGFYFSLLGIALLSVTSSSAGTKILKPSSMKRVEPDHERRPVYYENLSKPSRRNLLNLERDNPWSLPRASGVSRGITTLKILALRVDFIKEIPDDDCTTGDGTFDFRDTTAFLQEYKHLYDPSPHNRQYFRKHLDVLADYYFKISNGTLVIDTALTDVYPLGDTVVYHLPQTMKHYGEQPPGFGLYDLYYDAFTLADTITPDADHPDIDFSDWDCFIIFHAGADAQNDLYFSATPTPCDLYTAFITIDTSRHIPVYVNKTAGDSLAITEVMIMPEQMSQDNKAVAMNATLAHEFGHQLGLVDLYRTANFATKVGDFALMDNNGFGTAIEFPNYPDAGGVLGCMPIFPMAWSRVYLGFDSMMVLRQGTPISVAAAELETSDLQIAKIPISEHEYFLIENRQQEVDGQPTYILADSVTSVFLGPGNIFKETSREYDILTPGSGMLIWHVDESVARMDFNNNGYNNFYDNQLQCDTTPPIRLFIKLVEADGYDNFGATYPIGYGTQWDMYYAGNNSAFTPNTNPSSFGFGGANSHVRITEISESDIDMTFNLETEMLSNGFPRRTGNPAYALTPIAADIDNDDSTEIIVASGRNLLVIRGDGSDYSPPIQTSRIKYDTVRTVYTMKDTGAVYRYPMPLFAAESEDITAGPVVGDFGGGIHGDSLFVAIAAGNMIHVYDAKYHDTGIADTLFAPVALPSTVVWLSFGDTLSALVQAQDIRLYNISFDGNAVSSYQASPPIQEEKPQGAARIGGDFVVLAGDNDETSINLYYVSHPDTIKDTFDLEGSYIYGPVVADLNRDDNPEVIVCTPEGDFKAVTVDTSQSHPFSLYRTASLYDSIYANPVIADIDEDGYPDIIAGGKNKVIGLDRNMVTLMNFPIPIDRAYPGEHVVSSPVIGDINNDKIKDIIVVTSAGNCYALSSQYSSNDQLLYGFPLSAGFPMEPDGFDVSPAMLYKKNLGGGLGFLGNDGWFYSYDVGYDSSRWDWPMGGGNPEGTYSFATSKLGAVNISQDRLPEDKFFCYPNPTLDGITTIRFYVGEDADVTLKFYDMTGKRVSEKTGISALRGETHDEEWNGSSLSTGVYRCVIEAKFTRSGETLTSFTDIAIIK